ncbi:MAG: AarF/ABC1/UbiB kinase family protein [Candidatus Eremiobacteraeota bacterium]|nr:AarF/ABC1/UbiB kinase family protein [Candidatus Eremiobacteraeota bacterium]
MQPETSSAIPQPPRSKEQRSLEIVSTLARHGIGVVGEHFGQDGEERDRSRAEHVRKACEELGPVFIKLGQMLSARGDLLPEAYQKELAKLQDDVPPLPADAIAEVVRECLGALPEQIFASFDREPLASASIGQVHAARLHDGRSVVVKVRKPGVEEIANADLEILSDLVKTWSPRFPVLGEYDAQGVLREFSDSLRAEMDYRREAANARFFRTFFAGERGFSIPAVIGEHSGACVLTQERIVGRKVSELAGLTKRRRATLSRRIARFMLEPAFGQGLFYADPHPGNLLIEDGALGVVDFGMVGRLTPEARRRVAGIFLAIGRRDAERLTDRLIDVTAPTHPIDRPLIAGEIERLLERYVDVSFDEVPLANALGELLHLLRRHRLRLPANLAQLFKALMMCEAILQTVDPEASLTDYLEPLADKLIYEGVAGGDAMADRLRDSALDAAELTIELPRRIDRVLNEVERGNLRVWARIDDVEPLMRRFERTAERVNATVLAAACIVALAIVLQFYRPSGWQQWIAVPFWIGITAVIVAVVRMLVALRR